MALVMHSVRRVGDAVGPMEGLLVGTDVVGDALGEDVVGLLVGPADGPTEGAAVLGDMVG